MELFKKYKVAEVIGKKGDLVREIMIVKHGNMSYRVWLGNVPVDYIFNSEADALASAKKCAYGEASVLARLAEVKWIGVDF